MVNKTLGKCTSVAGKQVTVAGIYGVPDLYSAVYMGQNRLFTGVWVQVKANRYHEYYLDTSGLRVPTAWVSTYAFVQVDKMFTSVQENEQGDIQYVEEWKEKRECCY